MPRRELLIDGLNPGMDKRMNINTMAKPLSSDLVDKIISGTKPTISQNNRITKQLFDANNY